MNAINTTFDIIEKTKATLNARSTHKVTTIKPSSQAQVIAKKAEKNARMSYDFVGVAG